MEWKERLKSIDKECKKRNVYPYSSILRSYDKKEEECEDLRRQYRLMYAGLIGTLILMFGMIIAFVAINNYTNKIIMNEPIRGDDAFVCQGNACSNRNESIFISSTESFTYLDCKCEIKAKINGGAQV